MTILRRRLGKDARDEDVELALGNLRDEEKRGRGKGGRPVQPPRDPWTRILVYPDGTSEVTISDEEDDLILVDPRTREGAR